MKVKSYTKKNDERMQAERKIAFLRLRKPKAPKFRLRKFFNQRTLRIFWLVLAIFIILSVVVFPLIQPFLYTPGVPAQ